MSQLNELSKKLLKRYIYSAAYNISRHAAEEEKDRQAAVEAERHNIPKDQRKYNDSSLKHRIKKYDRLNGIYNATARLEESYNTGRVKQGDNEIHWDPSKHLEEGTTWDEVGHSTHNMENGKHSEYSVKHKDSGHVAPVTGYSDKHVNVNWKGKYHKGNPLPTNLRAGDDFGSKSAEYELLHKGTKLKLHTLYEEKNDSKKDDQKFFKGVKPIVPWKKYNKENKALIAKWPSVFSGRFEESEQLDELSRKTLGNYTNRAAVGIGRAVKRLTEGDYMLHEDFVPIADVITLVANDQHGEATGIVNDLLSSRILGALQTQKQVVAQNLFPSQDAQLAEETEQLDEAKYDYDKIKVPSAKRVRYQKLHGVNWFGRYLKDHPGEKEKAKISK